MAKAIINTAHKLGHDAPPPGKRSFARNMNPKNTPSNHTDKAAATMPA
jgi:hypothetical protein